MGGIKKKLFKDKLRNSKKVSDINILLIVRFSTCGIYLDEI